MLNYNAQPRPDLFSYANEMATKYRPSYNAPKYSIVPAVIFTNQGNTGITAQQLFVGYTFTSITLLASAVSQASFYVAPGFTTLQQTFTIRTESVAGRQFFNFNTGLQVFNYIFLDGGTLAEIGGNGYLITYSV
jgi:hypothetical protein